MPSALSFVLLVAVVASWFVITPAKSYACSCAFRETPAEELANSTAVFRATVTDICVPRGPVFSSADPVPVTFRVHTLWKGPSAEALVATTARSSASCGYEFVEGLEYLVYARGDGRNLSVSLCSRTMPVSQATDDLAHLGPGRAPVPGPWSTPTPQASGCNLRGGDGPSAVDLSLVTIVLGLIGLVLRRRP